MKVLQFLVLIFLVSAQNYVVNAQTYVVFESKFTRVSNTLYIENPKKIDTTSGLSNIAFIQKTEKIKSKKVYLDTLFFENSLSEKPTHPLVFKISSFKVDSIKNRYKHYFVYNTDPWKNDSIPKDSIVLNSYFKVIDKQKPLWHEPLNFYDFNSTYNHLEKPIKYNGYGCLGKNLSGIINVDFVRKQNAKGWLTNGFKTGVWVFYKYGFFKVEEQYKKGIRDGFYNVYNKEGSIVYTTNFKSGTGEQRIYRSDGSLYHIKFFENGEIDYTKPFTIFHSNGKPAIVYNYSQHKLIKYYNNGFLFSEQDFIINNNQIIFEGVYKGYSFKIPNALREKTYYKKNKQIYRTLYNYKDKVKEIHTPKTVQYYEKGKLIRIETNHASQYFKNGKVEEVKFQ